MKSYSRLISLVFISSIFLMILGCGEENDPNALSIGTIAGPETELVEVAKEVAKSDYGLNIKIVSFNDYVEPNRALVDGEIKSNMFQHEPYLNNVVASQGWDLINVGKLFVYPMGAYSARHKNIDDLPKKAVVAIPNDASNQARSLLLLEKAKLITLDPKYKQGKNLNNLSIKNIIANPKKIEFEEVDPAFMARMLDDLDLAVINTNYATMVNLLPNRDALISEDKDSLYANILVVRKQDKNNDDIKHLLAALRSDKVVAKAKELFKGQAIIAW